VGKNKLAKFEEINNFKNVIQIPYRYPFKEDFNLKGKWARAFFKNENPIVLEIGCGKGEYTLALAEQNPDKNYIGLDIKGARIWKGAKAAVERKMNNVAFIRSNAEIADRIFGKHEIEEIWLTFPDPQMKKLNRRLTSTYFMNLYRDILKNEGVINLKTDSNFQYSYTRELAIINDFEILAESDNLYESQIVNEILQVRTYYEQQWLSRGIPIKYLAFRIKNRDLNEPEVDIEKDSYRSFGRSARVHQNI
jgi:tRNA (guanine-N7-)-methyltransferase